MANEEKEMYELAEKYGYTIEKEYCFDMDYKSKKQVELAERR